MNAQREAECPRTEDMVDHVPSQGPSHSLDPDRGLRIVSVAYLVQDLGLDLGKGGKIVPGNMQQSHPEIKWIQELKMGDKGLIPAQETEGKRKDRPVVQTKLQLHMFHPRKEQIFHRKEKKRRKLHKEAERRTNVLE